MIELIREPLQIGTDMLPPLYPEWLGDPQFLSTHKLRFPYIVGEMAGGIATAEMVIAAVRGGMMGFFGAAGLSLSVVEQNIDHIQTHLGTTCESWGSNLIHSPQEPQLEKELVDLYIRKGVKRLSASAYMSLSPDIVYYACKGLHLNETGQIIRDNHVIAKLSRPEVATHFISPAPAKVLKELVMKGALTEREAELASYIPVAEDITVEGDSGGHTDNRPLGSLFPVIFQLGRELEAKYNYATPIRVGAAGGLGTPASVASAFALGASYVLTGSINQSAVESALSPEGKRLLSQAGIADMMMAPSADMFELGVKVQVLKRGTLFGSRAAKLYELYSNHSSIDEISLIEKKKIEEQIFQKDFASVWETTKNFFEKRDPSILIKAEQNPKFKMALIFRWYLGLSSKWAVSGEETRGMDYQIWCSPAIGAFNSWVKGTFLEPLENRTVVQIGLNLLEGAAVLTRAQQLRSLGIQLPPSAFHFTPRPLC